MQNFEIGDIIRTKSSRTDRIVVDIVDGGPVFGQMLSHRTYRDGKATGKVVSSMISDCRHV